MGKHTEWRKIAKKFRRKRIRQQRAQEQAAHEERVRIELENSPGYQERLRNEEKAEKLRLEEEQRIHDELEAKWMENERIAQMEWRELQKKLELLRKERAKQNAKIREEWEREKKKLREIEESKKKELEEKLKQQELLQEEINHFLEYGGAIPEHFNNDFQTNPGKTVCPFFSKTSTCRFGDICSRNHIRPAISKILLIHNFYSHYSLVQTENEHGNSALEFENSELYDHFKDFFYDVVPEMEKFGGIKQIIVCCNAEIHLRGNVFVEYYSEREALLAYKSLNGRWYAGKQLSVQFSGISSWKAAICGLFHRRKCPKGASCNFIHRFMNPNRLYFNFDDERFTKSPGKKELESNKSPRRDWRWSESPENDCNYESDWENSYHTPDRPHYKESRRKSRSERSSKSDRSSHRSSRDVSKSRKHRDRSESCSEKHKRRKKDHQSNGKHKSHHTSERKNSKDSR